MIKLSNSVFIGIVTKLLILLVVAKALSLIVLWFMPSDGVELSVKDNFQPTYQRVNFSNMIMEPLVKVEAQATKDTSISMTNMILKGLYGNTKKGFIIVAMKDKPKETSIVGINEDFKGYILKSILIDSALFKQNGAEYVLNLEDMDKEKADKMKNAVSKAKVIVPEGEAIGVTRDDIEHFAKNPADIWRDISIVEVKKGTKIEGFKVTNINKKSKFAALGLQKNDIIIKANNIELKSYKDAIDIYSKINKINTMQIVVKRDNQEVELVYEIH